MDQATYYPYLQHLCSHHRNSRPLSLWPLNELNYTARGLIVQRELPEFDDALTTKGVNTLQFLQWRKQLLGCFPLDHLIEPNRWKTNKTWFKLFRNPENFMVILSYVELQILIFQSDYASLDPSGELPLAFLKISQIDNLFLPDYLRDYGKPICLKITHCTDKPNPGCRFLHEKLVQSQKFIPIQYPSYTPDSV